MSAPGSSSGACILIVEDNAVNRRLARTVLSLDGYRVLEAVDATEARALLATERPDLVLMDVQLPGTNGLDLTRELRAQPEFAHLPIIAMTAYAMDGDRDACMAVGCDGYLSKPLDVSTFASSVAEVLRRAAGR